MYTNELDGKFFKKDRPLFVESKTNNLDDLLFQSGLTDPNHVKKEKWETLSRQCRWIVTSNQFLIESSNQKGKGLIGKSPVVLGISPYELTRAVGLHISGDDFEAYYRKYGIDYRTTPNHTEIFLKKIEEDYNVSSIVFLVPPDTFDFDAPPGYPWGTTKKEIQYLLDHPSKKLILVLGAYEMIDDNNFKLSFISDQMRIIDRKSFPKDTRRARWKIASDMKKFVTSQINSNV